MAQCPNKNLQDWQRLVDTVGEKGAYYTFMKNDNKVPYLQDRGSNRMIWDIESAYNLVAWESDNGKRTKLYEGFSETETKELESRIREAYVGDYTISRIAPDTEGLFGIKIDGFPVPTAELEEFKEDFNMEEAEALDNLQSYKELELKEEEANEAILPPQTTDVVLLSNINKQDKKFTTYIDEAFNKDVTWEDIYENIFDWGDKRSTTTFKVLNRILKNKYVTPNQKELYDLIQVLKTSSLEIKLHDTIKDKVPGAYMYIEDGKVIHVGLEEIAGDAYPLQTFVNGIVHETVHGFTLASLEKDTSPHVKEIKDIYKLVKDRKDLKKFYGITDVKEFVSEMMSDDSFRKAVERLEPTLYQRFIKALKELFYGPQEDVRAYNTIKNLIEYNITKDLEGKQSFRTKGINASAKKVIDEAKLTNMVNVLKESMPKVVDVVLDRKLEVAGRVMPGGKTIKINPELVTEDIPGHEFAHILIDLLGGMSNDFIIQGYEQLINSKAYEKVKKDYPELEETDHFKKEVLATAVGWEVANIFDEVEKQDEFENWLVRWFRKLLSRFGLNKTNARKLAEQVVGTTPINRNDLTGTASDYAQDAKAAIDPKKDPVNTLKAVKSYSDQIVLDESEKFYNMRSRKLERASKVLAEQGLSITEEEADRSPAVSEQARIGDVVHANLDTIGQGSNKVIQLKNGVNITPRAHKQLQEIHKEVFGDQYTMLQESKIGDPSAALAGTVDVLAIDKKGKTILFDYKTKKKYNDKGKYSGFKNYEFGYQGQKSQREKNSAQLTLYKEAYNRTIGLKVDEMKVVQLVTDTFMTTDSKGNPVETIKSVELEKVHSTTGVVDMATHPNIAEIYNDRQDYVKDVEEAVGKKMEDISEEEMIEKAEAIKTSQLARRIQNKKQRAREEQINVVNSRLMRDKAVGRTVSAATLKELLNILADKNTDDTTAITAFVQNAVDGIGGMYADYEKRLKQEEAGVQDAFTVNIIKRWYTILNAYDSLEDVATLMFEGEFKDEPELAKNLHKLKEQLDDAIKKKNILRDQYKERGVSLQADILAKYSTNIIGETKEFKRREWIKNNKGHGLSEKTRTEKMNKYAEDYVKKNAAELVEQTNTLLQAEMLKASKGDINLLERWLDSPLNTNDVVVAAMIKRFVTIHHQVRQQAIDYRNEMLPILKELETKLGYSTNMAPEEFYDFMLEKDKDNNLTGSLLTKFRSDLMQARRVMYKETEELPEKDRKRKRAAWYKANMPKNYKAEREALTKHMDTLKQEGIITAKEAAAYWANEANRGRKLKLDQIFRNNPEGADAISKWKGKNAARFVTPTTRWENKQWDAFEKDILSNKEDPRTRFYEFIVDKKKEADSYLPTAERDYTRLPFVLKSTRERILSGQSGLALASDKVKDLTKKRADDDTRGRATSITDENNEPVNFVPVYFQRNEATYKTEDQSFDLASIFGRYYKMAVNYTQKMEIMPEMELVKTLLEEREYVKLDTKGNPIKQALDTLGTRALTKSGKKAHLVEQYTDFMKSLLYGQTVEEEGDWDVLGYKIDKAKARDALGKYTAYNLLGLNMVQGIANVQLGEIQNAIEAVAGEFFDTKDLRVASTTYLKELGGILGDIGERAPSSLVGLMNEKWDILNEYEGGQYRKNKKWAQLMHSSTLFFTSNMGEHFMQTRIMLAMLQKVRAYDSKGENIGSMYDQYSVVNGSLVLSDEVDRIKSNWRPEQEILFGEKAKRLLSRLHGEYSELGKVSAQRWSIGRLAMMFRKFVVPGYKKRWENKRYNEFLGEYTEGSYGTTLSFLKRSLLELRSLGIASFTENWEELLPREVANIKRAISELAAALILALVIAPIFLAGKADADDDAERWMFAMASYLSIRTYKELAFFMSPTAAMDILRSPAAAVSSIENLGKLINQLITNPAEQYVRKGPWKYKISKKAVQLVPAIKQIYRTRDIEDILSLFVQ